MVISDTTMQVMHFLHLMFEDTRIAFIELMLHVPISVKTSETQIQPFQMYEVLKI